MAKIPKEKVVRVIKAKRATGMFRQAIGLRFRGCDDSLASFTAIEADVEAYGNGGQ